MTTDDDVLSAQSRVDRAYANNHYQVLSSTKTGPKMYRVRLLDKNRNVEFEYDLGSFTKCAKNYPDRIYNKTEAEDTAEVQQRIDEAGVPGRYTAVRVDRSVKYPVLTLTDNRCGTTFTYLLGQFGTHLKKNPDRVYYMAGRGNVVSVANGVDPLTHSAQVRINKISGSTKRFKVLAYDSNSDRVTVKDLQSGGEDSYKLDAFLGNLARGKKIGVKNKTPEAIKGRIQKGLDSLSPDRFVVLTVGKVDENTVATVRDKVNDKIFTEVAKYVINQLKENPNQVFGRTKEEISAVRRATNMEKYGVEVPLQSPVFVAKSKATQLEKYGVESYSSTKEYREKFKATNMERHGVEHPMHNPDIAAKAKATSMSNHGGVFHTQDPEIKDKAQVTNLERYGSTSPFGSKEVQDKIKSTMLDKYGVDNAMKSPEIQARSRKTSMERYGTEYPAQSEEVQKKIKATNLERYGVSNYGETEEHKAKMREESTLLDPAVRETIANTLQEKYGVRNPAQAEEVQKQIRATRIEKGITRTLEGKTLSEFANSIGSSYSFVQQLVRKFGTEAAKPFIDSYTPGGSSLTTYVANLLSDFNPIIDKKLVGTPYRPDLLFPAEKVIVEADGLYWHSEGAKNAHWNPDEHYHSNKKKAYDCLGYKSLFFRSDEIANTPHIVHSIVMNALGKNTERVLARKCSIVEIDPIFFTLHHLMGKGTGRCYGLEFDGKIVAGIQVKAAKKAEGLLDISRFATASGTTVVGGWSRLLSHVIKTEKPVRVQTFIDRRYGTGQHLASLGWKFIREQPSFKWTDGVQSLHRMSFPGSTGIGAGFFRIWDCGQAKWEFQSLAQ